MGRLKEIALNGLLAILVLSSIVLSGFVWFPREPWRVSGPKKSQVATTPPASEAAMPDLLRPERIYIRQKENKVALLAPGSDTYDQVWSELRWFLTGLQADPHSAAEKEPETPDDGSITMVWPRPVKAGEWVSNWRWNMAGLSSADETIDRVTMTIRNNVSLSLSGPDGASHRVGTLSDLESKRLRELIAKIKPGEFLAYRPLNTKENKDLPRTVPDLLVPDIAAVKTGKISFKKLDPNMEEARYFPDLSVVRQIDEQDAKTFTDGQRLLKFYPSGILEYWTVTPAGTWADIGRAKDASQDWIGAHGGWIPDLMLSEYKEQPNKSILLFEIRAAGLWPVESADGATRVEASVDRSNSNTIRVNRFKRFPEISSVSFGSPVVSVHTPEEALKAAAKAYPDVVGSGPVREIYPAYLMEPETSGDWVLEPEWVIQAGDRPVYVPADVRSAKKPRVPIP